MQPDEEVEPHLPQRENCFYRARALDISTNYRTESERTESNELVTGREWRLR